jgi:hypothetical protein
MIVNLSGLVRHPRSVMVHKQEHQTRLLYEVQLT